MGIQDVLTAAETVGDRDRGRRETFRAECDGDFGGNGAFDRTREALSHERDAVDELRDMLETEEEHIDEVVEHTAFLTVDQAVRNRDETVEKLKAHNDHLWEFHDEIAAALDVIESNLEALVDGGPDAVNTDPQPHFERAREALQRHNEAVEGLGTNMTILNAYLI